MILILGLNIASEPLMVYGEPQKTTNARKRKNTGKKNTTSKTSSPKNNVKSSTKQNDPKTSEEAKRRQEAARKEIKQTEEQIRENDNKVKKSLADLGKLDQDISITTKKISELNGELGKLNKEIKGLEEGISVNESELGRLREEYLKAVKKMRVTKKNKSTLAFIFSSNSVSQAMRRMRYLKEFSSWRDRQTDEINGKIETLKRQKEALAKAETEQKRALGQQQNNKAKLAEQYKRQEVLVAELKQNGKALESHLKRKQAEATELGNMVSQLIAQEQRAREEEERRRAAEEEARRKAEEEARRKAEEEQALLAQAEIDKKSEKGKDKGKPAEEKKKADKKKDNKEEKPTQYADARKRKPRSEKNENVNIKPEGGNFQDQRGKLPYPSTGSFYITSRFGRQHLPDLPDVEYDNPGIDAESDAGASARAVYQGKVSGVYLLPGYNTVVIVNHGNYYTVYGNIKNPSVKIGDSVEAGSTLGVLALNDEDSRHSSIHFEVWRNREKLNPQEWLR